jgi:hypothetical protein
MQRKVTIELLPGPDFIIRIDTVTVKGRFSMYALDRFCERKKLANYFEIIAKLTVGMRLHEYAELLLVAIEDYYRQDFEQCCVLIDGSKQRWTTELVFDLILDNIGGLSGNTAKRLFEHAVGRLTEVIGDGDGDEAEKKKRATPAKKKNL